MVLLCEHSRYPVLKLSNNLTKRETIRILKKVFDEFGYPNSIKSDNGPAFKSREFANFCQEARITHVKVTPLWPRANGMCERFMRNINKVIRCSKISPHSSTGVSPNQLMQFENDNGMISSIATFNINFKQIAFENDFK